MTTRSLSAFFLAALLCASAAFFVLPSTVEAALSRTLRLTDSQQGDIPLGGGASYTTSSFTPSNNSLLVVVLSIAAFDNDTSSLTVAGGGLTWTRRVIATESGNERSAIIWTAPVTTGASMDITLDGSTGDVSFVMRVYDYTGYNTSSPIGATAAQGNVTTITLSGAPATDSEVLGVWESNGASSIAVGGSGGFTEIAETLAAVVDQQTQSRTGSVSTTVDWSVSGHGQHAAAAVEIKAEAAQAATRSTLSKPPNNLGLVGYWSFNEGTGSIATDFSGNGNTATTSSAVQWVNGKRGKAVSFDSTYDMRISDTASLRLAGARTVSAWFNAASLPAGGNSATFVSKGESSLAGSNYSLGIDNGNFGCPSMSIVDVFTSSGPTGNANCYGFTPTIGTWYHVVGVYNPASVGTEMTLYVNGVQVSQKDTTGNVPVASAGLVARLANDSKFPSAGGDYSGKLDEVRIYNRALGASEIAALARAGAVKFTSSSVELQQGSSLGGGLVGHWTFDGPDVTTTVSDRSGQGNHGYFAGIASSSAKASGKLGQALRFAGSSGRVNVTNESNFDFERTEPFSFSLWLYRESYTAQSILFSKGYSGSPGFNAYVNDPGVLANSIVFFLWNDTGSNYIYAQTVEGSVPLQEWVHVAGTYTGSSVNTGIEIYINGVLQTPTRGGTLSGTMLSDQILTLGASIEGGSVEGKLDDMRIYDRVLTAAEIKQLYNLGKVKISN